MSFLPALRSLENVFRGGLARFHGASGFFIWSLVRVDAVPEKVTSKIDSGNGSSPCFSGIVVALRSDWLGLKLAFYSNKSFTSGWMLQPGSIPVPQAAT